MIPAPDVATQAADIQAIVGTGFAKLRKAHYVLMQVVDPVAARAWIARTVDSGLVKSVADIGSLPGDGRPHSITRAMMLAISHAGLEALGLTEHPAHPFPTAFKSGMASPLRAQLLGEGNHDKWTWGDVPLSAGGGVHVLAAHFSDELDAPVGELLPDAIAPGFRVLHTISSCPSYIDDEKATEPFGFRDGIANPVIAGLRKSASDDADRAKAGALFDDRVVAPGEILLGHVNEYGERSNCPDLDGTQPRDASGFRFGQNGSYLAVRQIYQHVAQFRKFEADHPPAPESDSDAPTAAEKLIGRKKSGESLVAHPAEPPEIDAFRYRVNDLSGFQCPRGAHVRRANPRDTLGVDVESGVRSSKLHRLLRRGRVFAAQHKSCIGGTCAQAIHTDTCGKGLFFIALNADLDRQFEFVQRRWIGNPNFGDLSGEDDPILGCSPARSPTRAFSVPGLPCGQRELDIEHFTEVHGGGYFFLPGLAALRRIGSL